MSKTKLDWRKEPGYPNMHSAVDATGKEVADVQGMQGLWRFRLRSNLGEWSKEYTTVLLAKHAAELALKEDANE